MSQRTPGIDRRDFLFRASATAALAGAGIATAHQAAARPRVPKVDPQAPATGRLLNEGEPIGIAVIGVGGMGSGHLKDLAQRQKNGENIRVRAVVDCYTRRQNNAKQTAEDITGENCDAYYDYNKVLERDDIHAVVVATPDHWHAPISIHAMEAGKDVYCQKPVTLTIEEALDVRDAVYRTGRVFQCGSQHTSNDGWWQARDFIRNGGIGEVVYAQADYSRNSGSPENPQGGEWNYNIQKQATDDPNAGEWYVDWETWIKPAPRRPFSPARFFQFRKFWDYSGGIATDLLYHVIAPMTIALDLSAPEMVTGSGGIFVQHDDREVPDTFFITAGFPEECSMLLTSSMANNQPNQTMIRGHRATIYATDRTGKKMSVKPEAEFKEWFKKEHGAEEIHFEPRPREDHMTNFLNACRTRGAVHCDVDTALKAQCVVKMGVEAYRQEKTLFYDASKECLVDSHPRPNRKSKQPTRLS